LGLDADMIQGYLGPAHVRSKSILGPAHPMTQDYFGFRIMQGSRIVGSWHAQAPCVRWVEPSPQVA